MDEWEKYELHHEIPFTKGGEIGRTVDYSAGRNRYIGYLISLGVYSFKGMRIGLDCAKKKLSELTADLAIYPQVLENVRVHDKAAAQADVDVQAAVESVAEALGDTGRILVRESGTEPLRSLSGMQRQRRKPVLSIS